MGTSDRITNTEEPFALQLALLFRRTSWSVMRRFFSARLLAFCSSPLLSLPSSYAVLLPLLSQAMAPGSAERVPLALPAVPAGSPAAKAPEVPVAEARFEDMSTSAFELYDSLPKVRRHTTRCALSTTPPDRCLRPAK